MNTDAGPPDRLVAGETVISLFDALKGGKQWMSDDGMGHVKLELDPAVAAPLARALIRVEAELLLEDADGISKDNLFPPRTARQRRADALMALVRKLVDAAPS
jgi:hypothetical protein